MVAAQVGNFAGTYDEAMNDVFVDEYVADVEVRVVAEFGDIADAREIYDEGSSN